MQGEDSHLKRESVSRPVEWEIAMTSSFIVHVESERRRLSFAVADAVCRLATIKDELDQYRREIAALDAFDEVRLAQPKRLTTKRSRSIEA
jgi:hypothetical protein